MSKYRITRKSVREEHEHVLSIGYCNLAELLRYESPYGYATRAEGWAFDVYSFGDTAITTGYAPIGKDVPYELQREYNNKAKEIDRKYDYTEWEKKRDELHELALEFIEKANQRKRRVKK